MEGKQIQVYCKPPTMFKLDFKTKEEAITAFDQFAELLKAV